MANSLLKPSLGAKCGILRKGSKNPLAAPPLLGSAFGSTGPYSVITGKNTGFTIGSSNLHTLNIGLSPLNAGLNPLNADSSTTLDCTSARFSFGGTRLDPQTTALNSGPVTPNTASILLGTSLNTDPIPLNIGLNSDSVLLNTGHNTGVFL